MAARTQEAAAPAWPDVDGAELLRPPAELRASDQARVLARLGAFEQIDVETVADLDKVADLIDWIGERFAVDEDRFSRWSQGDGGMSRAMALAMAWGAEVGKLSTSETGSSTSRSS